MRGTNRPPATAIATGAAGAAGTTTPAGTFSRYMTTLAMPPVLASTRSDSSGIGAGNPGAFSNLGGGGGPSNVMTADNAPFSPSPSLATRSAAAFQGIPGIDTESLAWLVIRERRSISGVVAASGCTAPTQVSAKKTDLSNPPNDGSGWRGSNGRSSGFVHGTPRCASTASSVEPGPSVASSRLVPRSGGNAVSAPVTT